MLEEEKTTAKTKKEEKSVKWVALNDCYAGGVLYNKGDTVEGGDFSKNANFKKLDS